MSDKLDEWNALKHELNETETKHIKKGHIYWVSIGQNIGSEIYGKNKRFLRPVLVLNIFFIKGVMHSFIGIPLTSKPRYGFMYFKFIDSKNIKQTACLSQIRLFDTRRVHSHLSRVDDDLLSTIRQKINDDILKGN